VPSSASIRAGTDGQAGDIITVEGSGVATCKVSPNTSFIAVKIPLRSSSESPGGQVQYRYAVGSFRGRETGVSLAPGRETVLRFRVPRELFRPRERLSVEIFEMDAAGAKRTLWSNRWEITWEGETPSLQALEPVAE